MSDVNNSEQWLLAGDCDECRRQKYCKTECKAHKNSIQLSLQPQTNGAMKAMLNAINTKIKTTTE